jgi:HlyD family secretion protein
VILRNVDAGQTVAASLQAPVLFTIAQDLRDMQVEAAIDEADVGRLRAGMPATFAVDAFPAAQLPGRHPADPQVAAERAERGELHRGDLGRQPRHGAAAGDDRQRAHRGREPRERAQGSERRAALASRPARPTPRARRRWTPPAQQQQAGGQAVQQFRARIQAELKPSDAQKAQIDDIFNDSRQKFGGCAR